MLYATALRLCRNAADARDLVQDTFEYGLRDLRQLRSSASLRGWLTSILYHRFLDRCRRRASEPPRVPMEELESMHPVQEAVPVEAAWEQVTFEDLLAAVERLEEPFQQVYRLAALERRPQKEIAGLLGIKLETVGTRLLRARAKLKAMLLSFVPREEVH